MSRALRRVVPRGAMVCGGPSLASQGDTPFRRHLEALRAHLSLGTPGGIPSIALQPSKERRLGPEDQEGKGHAVHEMGEDTHREGDPTERP